MTKRRPKNRLRISQQWWPLLFIGVGLLVAGLIMLWPHKSSLLYSQGRPVDTCVRDNQENYDCYNQLLSTVVKEKGPQTAFDMLKRQYTRIAYVKSQCHQLAHIVGRAAYTKYGNLSDTYSHGDHFCWAGYYHGALEQLSKDKGNDYILTNSNDICAEIESREPYSFNHFNCVHGLGHGFMLVQDDELFTSLQSCDHLTEDYNRTSCYGGVFMQNVMEAYESPDHTSKYLRRDQPMYPCTAVAEQYKDQCYLAQTSYALQVVGYDFHKVFRLCAKVDSAYRDTCYQSTGRDASGRTVSDLAKTKKICLFGPTRAAQTNCVIGAVKDFISYYHDDQKGKQLCQTFPAAIAAVCNSTAVEYYKTFQ